MRGARHDRRQQAECRDGDGEGVITERPPQVLADGALGRAGQLDGRGHAVQVSAHQRQVARLDRNVRAGAYRDAQVGLDQRGRVVDAVTDHRDRPTTGLKAGDLVLLAIGQHLGERTVDADLGGDGGGCAVVVAGDHRDLHPVRDCLPDGLGRVVPRRVVQRQDAQKAPLARGIGTCHAERAVALGRELVDRLQVVNTRAIELTEALLLLSRADQPFTREHVDLSLIAEEAAETLLPLAEKRGVTIETSGAGPSSRGWRVRVRENGRAGSGKRVRRWAMSSSPGRVP